MTVNVHKTTHRTPNIFGRFNILQTVLYFNRIVEYCYIKGYTMCRTYS